ncbi:type III-B CRISPR module-associated protein Cmr5 [Marinobacterium stanieri]|uniref:type III-B CRISPR module-associated protein Cmr5 n=1 Tax=Marinobacterium stanieri TaxID=49186 RepID=UPI003A958802
MSKYGKKKTTSGPHKKSSAVKVQAVQSQVQEPSLSRQQTLSQQRAGFALQRVLSIKPQKGPDKRFKAYANSLPAMIQQNGLGQALAFAKMKGNGKGDEALAWKALYNTVSQWLTEKGPQRLNDSGDVLEALVAGDQYQYQRAQAEAQALLVWVKQFARAEIVGESNE